MNDTRTQPWPAARVEWIPYNTAHPDGVTSVFVQWKGTDACFDYWCECGTAGHFDGYFANTFECAGCHREYTMPATIYPAESNVDAFQHQAVTTDTRNEMAPVEPAEDTVRLMQRLAVVLDSEESARLGLNMIGFGTRDGRLIGHVQRNLLGNYDGTVATDPNTIIDLGPIRHPETNRG